MKILINVIPQEQRTNSRDIFQILIKDDGDTPECLTKISFEDVMYNIEKHLEDLKYEGRH